jgi:hypothetical protein
MPFLEDYIPILDACSRIESTTIDDMASIILRIARNLEGLSNPIITATFKSFDEETQFMRSLHQGFSEDAEESFLTGISFIIFQERKIPALFSSWQCRIISPGNFARIMRLSTHLAQPGDIFALRRPTNSFIVAYFSSYLNACYRIGRNLVGLITFVGDDYKREIVF